MAVHDPVIVGEVVVVERRSVGNVEGCRCASIRKVNGAVVVGEEVIVDLGAWGDAEGRLRIGRIHEGHRLSGDESRRGDYCRWCQLFGLSMVCLDLSESMASRVYAWSHFVLEEGFLCKFRGERKMSLTSRCPFSVYGLYGLDVCAVKDASNLAIWKSL